MRRILLTISMIAAVSLASGARASEKISIPAPPGLSRADIYVVPAIDKAIGTLVLCPGHNENGQDMVEDPAWSDFAKKLSLNLVGLSFASDDDQKDGGYFKAEAGSGAALLGGLKKAFGEAQTPLLMYGFSRGAQFTYTFCRWKPSLIKAWCAYSATEWERPAPGPDDSLGIIACGDEDEPNYSSAMFQFLAGRSMAKRWTWISIAHTGHCRSAALESFARAYFASVLHHPGSKGIWLDDDTKIPLTTDDLRQHPTLASWLPDESVAQAWKNLHQP